MVDEKTLDNEKLNEEELKNVAGGKGWEIREDKERFAQLGIYITSGADDERQLKQAFARYGIATETYHGDWRKNEYWDGNRKIDRDEAWRLVWDRCR